MKNELIRYIILEELITENRVTQAKDAYPCLPPSIIDYFSEKDPSKTNKYLSWMCRQLWDEEGNVNGGELEGFETVWSWLDEVYVYADYHVDDTKSGVMPTCSRLWNDFGQMGGFTSNLCTDCWIKQLADYIIEEVVFFHRFVSGLKQKDINQYNFQQLSEVLSISKLKSQEKELAKDVTKIYEDDTWLMISPKTHQASCVYGANTKWCVTTKGDPNYYQRYTRDDFYLIFVINKKENRKWAINTKEKLDQPTEDEVINIPWHREIDLKNRGPQARERFDKSLHSKRVGNIHTSKHRDTQTTYWNADDSSIGWDRFIESSKLPSNLQQLLKAIEKKVIINFRRKKKSDVAYEINPKPIRLKKGDRVKLLASGYGVYRGDEGVITSTYDGAPGRQKELKPENAGLYKVHVLGRKPYHSINDLIKDDEGNNRVVPVVIIGGNFLEKITKKK